MAFEMTPIFEDYHIIGAIQEPDRTNSGRGYHCISRVCILIWAGTRTDYSNHGCVVPTPLRIATKPLHRLIHTKQTAGFAGKQSSR
ncbi:hypothetical protein KP79_PYT04967 [Mizuhopecten yessoensis]|uniref:Uncharacterized protein n=1 Tax=Mizuhopecten yessoensis TaxID=6573 RepID=A0A210Q2S8_MIZYE|nr:hypothetical protein KP79_PYT04967 [Mizuhopecten yessoensis]